MILHQIEGYTCSVDCGYTADLAAYENREEIEARFWFVAYGTCPSCQIGRMEKRDNQHDLTTLEEADLEALTEVDRDDNGQPILIPDPDGATVQSIEIVDGKPAVVTREAMVLKTRPLTDEEKVEKKEQLSQTLDNLSSKSAGVKQVESFSTPAATEQP